MKQAEKALRDAGWEEINLRETCQGDEVYDLDEHDTYVINCPALPTWEGRVLRAPRPEPEYEPGTVARIKLPATGHELNAICLSGGTDGLPSWNGKHFLDEVEVVRVIAYPDGTTPTGPRPEPEYELGMVARVRRYMDGDEFNAVADQEGNWRGWDSVPYDLDEVEVLRVIAEQDGSTPPVDASKVTRFEVIDDTGRAYINTTAKDVNLSFQDDGRTLKVFPCGDERSEDQRVNREPGCDEGYDAGHVDGYHEGFAHGMKSSGLDRHELIEGMVPCVARALYYQNDGFSWDEATGGYRGEFERAARIALGEAYKEATK